MSNTHNYIGDAENGLLAVIADLQAALEDSDSVEEQEQLRVLVRTTHRLLKTVEGL